MTRTFILAHDYKFEAEGSGFRTAAAEADFEQIVSDIDAALHEMDAAEVGRIHTGSLINEETGDVADAKAFDALTTLANRKAADVLASWRNPDGAHIMIMAVPSKAKGREP